MDDLHELREMLTICADELQEVAQDDKKMTDAMMMLDSSMGEFIVVTALPNGKLAAWYIHKDAPLYYADDLVAHKLATSVVNYIKGFYLLTKVNEKPSQLTESKQVRVSHRIATRIDEMRDDL
jgi:hypothetical protein